MPKQSLTQFIGQTRTELASSKFALATFVVNSLRRRYRRSILGFAWSLLNPVFSMTIMTLVFAILWKKDPRSFGLYVFTGLLPWSFITDSLTVGSLSIIQAEPFLKKIYIPKAFFPIAAATTELVNFSLSLLSLLLVGIIFGLPAKISLAALPIIVGILYLFITGLTLIVSIGTVYFRDLTHIIRVVLNGAFYLLPIIYTTEMVPEQFQKFLLYNPFFYFIDSFHSVIYFGSFPSEQTCTVTIAVTTVTCLVALLILRRTNHDIIYRL